MADETTKTGDQPPKVAIKNDGSFLEQFLKMQQQPDDASSTKSANESEAKSVDSESVLSTHSEQKESKEVSTENSKEADTDTISDSKSEPEDDKKKSGPFGKFAKKAPFASSVKRPAGAAPDANKKKKKNDAVEESDNPAWQAYLKEVEKYRNASCSDEREHRPLVK